jgi:hypothetical protein
MPDPKLATLAEPTKEMMVLHGTATGCRGMADLLPSGKKGLSGKKLRGTKKSKRFLYASLAYFGYYLI